jgi:general secretion pathway protein E
MIDTPAQPERAVESFPATPPPPPPAPRPPSAEFLRLLPRDFARRHLVLSEGRDDTHELLRIAPGTPPQAPWNAGASLNRPVRTRLDDPAALARDIDHAYADPAPADDPPAPSGPDLSALLAADRELLSTSGKGPIVQLTDALIFDALSRRASDLHIQPAEDASIVRNRIDGSLIDVRTLPHPVAAGVISRLKIMGAMDIAEQRLPQDGRATVSLAGRDIDLRMGTLPTRHGERMVVRLLETQGEGVPATVHALGLPARELEVLLAHAARPAGIILITGPTGSGKTTTLYALLRWIASRDTGAAGCPLNIVTIEDPIEYALSHASLSISQSQVNARKGLTFASALRHVLRQDPDVIMVGEVRDSETARLALQASLTGHLVLSTLHTNDAPSAVTRLLDLGMEPYLVGASLSCVLAQRLVRVLHAPCAGARLRRMSSRRVSRARRPL